MGWGAWLWAWWAWTAAAVAAGGGRCEKGDVAWDCLGPDSRCCTSLTAADGRLIAGCGDCGRLGGAPDKAKCGPPSDFPVGLPRLGEMIRARADADSARLSVCPERGCNRLSDDFPVAAAGDGPACFHWHPLTTLAAGNWSGRTALLAACPPEASCCGTVRLRGTAELPASHWAVGCVPCGNASERAWSGSPLAEEAIGELCVWKPTHRCLANDPLEPERLVECPGRECCYERGCAPCPPEGLSRRCLSADQVEETFSPGQLGLFRPSLRLGPSNRPSVCLCRGHLCNALSATPTSAPRLWDRAEGWTGPAEAAAAEAEGERSAETEEAMRRAVAWAANSLERLVDGLRDARPPDAPSPGLAAGGRDSQTKIGPGSSAASLLPARHLVLTLPLIIIALLA